MKEEVGRGDGKGNGGQGLRGRVYHVGSFVLGLSLSLAGRNLRGVLGGGLVDY